MLAEVTVLFILWNHVLCSLYSHKERLQVQTLRAGKTNGPLVPAHTSFHINSLRSGEGSIGRNPAKQRGLYWKELRCLQLRKDLSVLVSQNWCAWLRLVCSWDLVLTFVKCLLVTCESLVFLP